VVLEALGANEWRDAAKFNKLIFFSSSSRRREKHNRFELLWRENYILLMFSLQQ